MNYSGYRTNYLPIIIRKNYYCFYLFTDFSYFSKNKKERKGKGTKMNELKLFIQSLPTTKKLPDVWYERYIYDVSTISGYEQAKEIAQKRQRYVLFSEISNEGYSTQPFEETCDQSHNETSENESSEEEKCSDCCQYNPVKEKCIYDARRCIDYFVQNVRNWSEVCGYHILFLQGKVPGTPGNLGPWNRETGFILDPLIRILSKNILTVDSQPGLFVSDDMSEESEEYIQKPYIRIAGPVQRIHRILVKLLYSKENTTFDNSVIKYSPQSLETINLWGYKNYQPDNQVYVSVMLGIDNPPYFYKEYVEYLFSNRFFDYIASVVDTTP